MVDKDQINEETQSVGENSSKRLGGDEGLSRLIQEEAEKIIRNNDIKSEADSIKDIEKRIAESLGVEVNDQIRVESKRIKKEVEKWNLKHIETVREHRKESVKKEIVEGYKKANPDISTEQLKLAEDQANLIADTYHGGPGIEQLQSEILAGPIGESVDLKGAYSHIEGTIKLLKNTPGQLKEIQSNYEKIKDGLSGLKQPTGIREFSSFDNIMGVLRNGNAMERFTGLGQSRVLDWADRINGWTGGAMGRTVADFGGKFISKIGSESVRTFAENGLKLLTEKGFQGGFNAILSGGASATAGAAASTAAAGGTAAAIGTTAAAAGVTVATGGIAALVMAGLAILKGIKNFGQKIRDGINNLVANGRGEDEDINKLTKKKWFIPVVILVLLLTGCTLQNNQISTMVSPTKTKKNSYELVSNGGFSVPRCDPTVNNREILRDIALSVVGKIKYDNDAAWNCIGACPEWIKGTNGVDCAKLASWVWLQCTGKSRAKEFGTTNHLVDNLTYKTAGWQRIYPNSLDDLKIGDIFIRIDKCKDGVSRCNHAGMYIGRGDSGVGEVLETVGNGGDPIITKIYSVKSGIVKFVRSKGFNYTYTIRITNVFND